MSFWHSLKKGGSQPQLAAAELVRVNRVKTDINPLNGSVQQQTFQLGKQRLDLFLAEALSETVSMETCQKFQISIEKMTDREALIEAIKLKTLLLETPEPGPVYSCQCSECKVPIPEFAIFCPVCDSRTEHTAKDGMEPVVEKILAQCPSSKPSLPVNTGFCPDCGN